MFNKENKIKGERFSELRAPTRLRWVTYHQ